jgi:hypothetical protein
MLLLLIGILILALFTLGGVLEDWVASGEEAHWKDLVGAITLLAIFAAIFQGIWSETP